MLIDGWIEDDLGRVGRRARTIEGQGYDGAWAPEKAHDPFLPLALAADHTTRLELGTAIAVAFARSPMTLATVAWDLQTLSQGRLLLGLGTQIKTHIEKRFSMPWSQPVARMREYVAALRAIWTCWQDDTRLDFAGDFYHHTLMTPFFNPGPQPFGPPKVLLAAVGADMTTMCGECADGMLVHGFTSERYFRDVTLPRIEVGLDRSGRDRSAFQIWCPVFVATGRTEAEMEQARAGTRRQIAFYASTPAYRGVLEHHGWGDLQPQLLMLSKRGEWEAMGDLIDDAMLDTYAVVGATTEIGPRLVDRFGALVDRLSIYTPYVVHEDVVADVVDGLRAARARELAGR